MDGVRVDGLVKHFGPVMAVDGISMVFEKGTLTTLLGPSGCGKTTTLRCIAGLEEPDEGSISIGGKVVFSGSVNVPPEKRDIGLVFQSYAIWPHMTVFDNVAYPLKLRHVPSQEIGMKVRRTVEMVRLTGLEQRSATQISGGQQQRVALARALVFDPQVLLLDEPLSNLDASLRDQVRVELREIQRSLGITTIYVTHDQTEALSISDRVAVMRSGKIVAQGTPREIYGSPTNEFVASFVGKANIFAGKMVSREGGITTVETGIGRLTCQGDSVPAGEDIIVTIKPENVWVTKGAAQPGLNTFPGTVELTSYLGAFTEVLLIVGGLRIRSVLNSSAVTFRDGDEVAVSLPPQSCLVVAAEKGKRP